MVITWLGLHKKWGLKYVDPKTQMFWINLDFLDPKIGIGLVKFAQLPPD